MKYLLILVTVCCSVNTTFGQWNFTFNYNSAGQRVALVEATISEITPSVTLHFIDSTYNSSNSFDIYRRPLHGNGADWILQTSLSAGTGTWTDLNVSVGDVWEYQVKRDMGTKYATGYVSAGIHYDQSNYKGRMILLVDSTMIMPLEMELHQLKRDLTGEGWFVEEIYFPRANGWYSSDTVVMVKQQIQDVWNAAPENDKPTHLFIIGHVPVPRSGLDVQPPDGHPNSNGALGSDTYYADLDGVYTDDSTFTPSYVLYDTNAVNLPNDYKWDQDFIPSELELAFGRIDFFEIGSYVSSETQLLKNYLNRLHDYRMGVDDMGESSAFRLGWANSYDGSYRSLIPISGANNVYLESGGSNHPLWVKNNGPFQAYLQNSQEPILSQWDADGMDATVYASDQSFWGHWAVPESGGAVGKIRALLAADTKCLVALWQTTAINVFYQPGIGETMGISCKKIMDHNITNNNIEKPEQSYDENDFWNRTHMQYHGDPAVRLFQVHPISNLTHTVINGNQLQLNWTASIEDSIVGYHVYKSSSELGEYQKISSALITDTTFTDVNVVNSNDWYMVRAIKLQITGSGTYLNPSMGVFIQPVCQCPSFTNCPSGYSYVSGPVIDLVLSDSWNSANGLVDVENGGSQSGFMLNTTPQIDMTVTVSVNGTSFFNSGTSGEIKNDRGVVLSKNSMFNLSFTSTITGQPIYLTNIPITLGDFEMSEEISSFSITTSTGITNYDLGYWDCFEDDLGVAIGDSGSKLLIDQSNMGVSYSLANDYELGKTAALPISTIPISGYNIGTANWVGGADGPVFGFSGSSIIDGVCIESFCYDDNTFLSTALNANWSDPANWSEGCVPSSPIIGNIIIDGNCTLQITSDFIFENGSGLTINSGNTLTISGTGSMSMKGTTTTNGTLNNTINNE